MTDSRTEHLAILKRARWQRNAILISIAFACIAFGAFLSVLYYQKGDWGRALLILLPFDVIFPLGLFSLARLAIGKNYSETEKLVRDREPIHVTVEDLDAISGQVRLRLSADVGFFRVDDPAYGLINALRCELKVFEAAQQEKRRQIAMAYISKDGFFYTGTDGEHAVLFVNDTAFRLQRITRQKAEELQELRNKLRKN